MKRLILVLIVLIFTVSCLNEQSSLFVGTYRIMDQMIPYPYIYYKKSDSVYLLNNRGSIIAKIKDEGLLDQTELNFNSDFNLKILKSKKDQFFAFNVKDTLNFESTKKSGRPNIIHAAKFEKISPTKEFDNQKFKEYLKGSVWESKRIKDENSGPNKDLEIKKLYYFNKDSVIELTNYLYNGSHVTSEYETKAYHLFQVDEVCFLSFDKGIDNPQPIYQINDYGTDFFELRDFSSKTIKNIKFNKSTWSKDNFLDEVTNTVYYSKCFDGYQGEYYFGHDVTFKKGNRYIQNMVNQGMPQTNDSSGYVIIHFSVNCEGSLGDFGVIQMNRAYKQYNFSTAVVSHLIRKVKTLNDFPKTESQLDRLFYKDVHGFLMFKIENNKVTDVCP